MKIGVPTEVHVNEQRVAMTPEVVGAVVKLGFEVLIEAGAGARASYLDEAYRDAGAEVVDMVDAPAPAIGRYEFTIAGQSKIGPVDPPQPASFRAGGQLPLHDHAGQICIRMAKRGQLPIQHRPAFWRLRSEERRGGKECRLRGAPVH